MEAYNIITTCEKPVVFMAATNYPDKIEKAMLSRIMTFVRVPLPSEDVRTDYFRRNLKGISLGGDIDEAYMADVTDNYCFRDLDKISVLIDQNIKRLAIERFAVRDESGRINKEISDELVANAIADGSVTLGRELFDEILSACPPEKKSDILASIEAFEKKK